MKTDGRPLLILPARMSLNNSNEAFKTIRLALPIIIGELAQMSLHIIDTAMVGSLGYKNLAATSLVFNAVNIPFVAGIGMTMSVSQMVSMANGRRDHQKVSHYFFNGFWLCCVFAVAISVLLLFSQGILFHLHQDPEVVRLAVPFLRLIAISIIPMLLFMTLKQFTDGLEFTRTAMMLSLGSLPINVFLNWLFIYGNWGLPKMGLSGAGWATLITRSLTFTILGLIILKHDTFRKYRLVSGSQWKLTRAAIGDLLRIGIPSSMQLGMEVSAFAVSGIIIGTMGAVPQAAHQIALALASFTFMVSMGLAQAGSIRVSNAFGRQEWPLIKRIGQSTLVTGLLWGIFCAVIFTLLRYRLPVLFTGNPAVQALSEVLLLYAAIFQISDATQAIGAGLLRGIKDVRTPTILVTVAYWVAGLPLGYFFAFNLGMGPQGIWLGFITGLTAASLQLGIRFLRAAQRQEKKGN